jgi:multiple sugar transport system ATP-binding protein
VAGSSGVREGARAQFAVPPSSLHFFDLSTGQAISAGRPLQAVSA